MTTRTMYRIWIPATGRYGNQEGSETRPTLSAWEIEMGYTIQTREVTDWVIEERRSTGERDG